MKNYINNGHIADKCVLFYIQNIIESPILYLNKIQTK